MSDRLDISKPKWSQENYEGRARHFLTVTNPMNIFASNEDLNRSKEIVTKYKKGASLDELNITKDELWKNKYLYDSAFHPDTGEKMALVGRMSAQVPMNMTITGLMMTFYKSTPAVVFWQWFNQSFNALVNYTNRSGSSPIPVSTLGISYVGATGGAVFTALTLNKMALKAPPLVGRLVPLAAVAAANCVNIPLMRFTEIKNGIDLLDDDNKVVGHSKVCAASAIIAVALSRIGMAVPGMVLSPILMTKLERRGFLARYPWSGAPIQVVFCGFLLTFATPLCCALFAQKVKVPVNSLDDRTRNEILANAGKNIENVYYNKGL